MFATKEKNKEYKNVPISLSYLHTKQHANLVRTARRASSESHKHTVLTESKGRPIANIQMSHSEVAV